MTWEIIISILSGVLGWSVFTKLGEKLIDKKVKTNIDRIEELEKQFDVYQKIVDNLQEQVEFLHDQACFLDSCDHRVNHKPKHTQRVEAEIDKDLQTTDKKHRNYDNYGDE